MSRIVCVAEQIAGSGDGTKHIAIELPVEILSVGRICIKRIDGGAEAFMQIDDAIGIV